MPSWYKEKINLPGGCDRVGQYLFDRPRVRDGRPLQMFRGLTASADPGRVNAEGAGSSNYIGVPKGTRTYVDAENIRASADCGLSLPLAGGKVQLSGLVH